MLMCGGVNDVGQELHQCYSVQMRSDCEDVIRGYEKNSYYIEVELVQFAPVERDIAVGVNYFVDLSANQLITFKGRALRRYDTQTLTLTGQCVVENMSEHTFVFGIRNSQYLYDQEAGTLYRIVFQQT